MANHSANILVGAANVAVGSYTGTQFGGNSLYAALRDKVTATAGAKKYREWITGTTDANDAFVTNYSDVYYGGSYCRFRDVGLTQEGVSVNYQPDFGEVEVDQLLDAAKLFKQKMTVTVATSFAEATLENLLNAWAQESGTLFNNTPDGGDKALYMAPGSLGDAPQEKALVFVGNAPNFSGTSYKQRVYMAARAISVEASEHGLRRTEATVFPVTFRLLPDTQSSYSAYGRIVDLS